MTVLQEIQLDLMLMLSGVCGAVSFFGLWTKGPKVKKIALFLMGIGGTILLIADRFAYIYRGNETVLGYWMVRICNFIVFFISLFIIHMFNVYLIELFRHEIGMNPPPLRLRFNEGIIFIGELLVVISQFTGLYYTFDETNRYQRAGGFLICYFIPLIIWIVQFSTILQYIKRFDVTLRITLTLFTTIPMLASIVQLLFYGLSLTNITIAGLILALRIIEVENTRQKIERAERYEMEMLLKEKENMRSMVAETANALAEAIEAKDVYTRGHSLRVAQYSELIARRYGKTKSECQNVYLTGLLHDVGKIGVPEWIINKDSRLTDEEYDMIKSHPVIGNQILAKISRNPTLAVGAHYHHERYDGKGYPDGLAGEEIPEIARIIAVADAYDAMTSRRSYRDSLPQQVVREEIVRGRGTQFDPEFADIMLNLIDRDVHYLMRET